MESFFLDTMMPLFSSFDLVDLVARRPKCKAYGDFLQPFTYLCEVSEDLLWDTYSHCLDSVGTDAFTDFSQDNKDSLTRLKLRSIEERIKTLSL